jgi:predicted transposase
MEKNDKFEMIDKNEIKIIAKLIREMRDKLNSTVNINSTEEDQLIHVTRQFNEMSRTADNLYLQLETQKIIKKLDNATLYDIFRELLRRIK